MEQVMALQDVELSQAALDDLIRSLGPSPAPHDMGMRGGRGGGGEGGDDGGDAGGDEGGEVGGEEGGSDGLGDGGGG